MADKVHSLIWTGDCLKLLDQTKLPMVLDYVECRRWDEVADAIRTMKVRGAPAIGAAAAFGVVLGAVEYSGETPEKFTGDVKDVIEELARTRPTAVNLFWALERMEKVLKDKAGEPTAYVVEALRREAEVIAAEDAKACRSIGANGAPLIKNGDGVLTICNAGALATVDYGTALGVIRAAFEQGKRFHVYAAETRPFLQGARLTAWELVEEGIPATLITDNMAGWVMQQGRIQLVIVGADRIAANGDTANKIGTYTFAVLARHHGIPFYIAAPLSTVDLSLANGREIPIEERAAREVTEFMGHRVAPEGIGVYNPAFDVTPAELITGIITEAGVIEPPYEENLARAFRRK